MVLVLRGASSSVLKAQMWVAWFPGYGDDPWALQSLVDSAGGTEVLSG